MLEAMASQISFINTIYQQKTAYINIIRAAPLHYLMFHAIATQWPASLPPCDVSALAANLLLPHTRSRLPFVVLDWELLPALLLLLGEMRPGASIYLPDVNSQGGVDIKEIMTTAFPNLEIKSGEIVEEGIFLGANPLGHTLNDSRFMDKMSGLCKGGVFVTNRDFLGVANNAHPRSLWLESGILAGVLQLPKFGTGGNYPAIMQLRASDPSGSVRMAEIDTLIEGNRLNLVRGVRALTYPETDSAKNVSIVEISRTLTFSLLPARYLEYNENSPGRVFMNLGECAQVLRCQISREKLEYDDWDATDDSWYLEAMEESGNVPYPIYDDIPYDINDPVPPPEYDDHSILAWELSLAEKDPMTGFVNPIQGTQVFVEIEPGGASGKYLLKANDIIFLFKGTEASLGNVALVEDSEYCSIPSLSCCIIRALPGSDAIWLFYYLQRTQMRKRILSLAAGKKSLTINMNSIRGLQIAVPTEWELAKIHKMHNSIVSDVTDISILRKRAQQTREKITKWGEEPAADTNE